MRQTWQKQREDPRYQYDTLLLEHEEADKKERDAQEGSLGDLDPRTLAWSLDHGVATVVVRSGRSARP